MKSSKGLFSEFSRTSRSDWEAKATADLRGKTPSELSSTDSDGITLFPYYDNESPVKHIVPKRHETGFEIIQEYFVADAAEANSQLLDFLNRGATGLLLYLLPNVNLSVLLESIIPEHIELHFVQEGNGRLLAEALGSYYESKGYDLTKCRGSINVDPLENLARTGNWFKDEENDWSDLTALVDRVDFAPWKTLCINANLFHNAGASPAHQIGIALSMMHEYLVKYGEVAAEQHWLNMAVGTDYFHNIAKLRAMRATWAFLLEQYEFNAADYPLSLHVETGIRDKTIYDPYTNMLRNTSSSMSAIIGGADSISVKPHDIAFKNPNEFSERIARNTPLVLGHESYFNELNDPAEGSYFIESLTDELAASGWKCFQEIEKEGGYVGALKSGYIQDLVAEDEAAESKEISEGSRAILGVNLYPNTAEKMKPEIEEALFCSTSEKETEVEPIQVIRASEELELNRLQDEA